MSEYEYDRQSWMAGGSSMWQARIIAILVTSLFFFASAALTGEPAVTTPPDGRLDVETDEVLATIRAAVRPSDEQMQRIVVLYRRLRESQHEAIRQVRRSARGAEGRDRPLDVERFREHRRKAKKQAREKIEAINAQFLADCRIQLRPEQLNAWDACASGLDLMPRMRGGRRIVDRSKGPEAGQIAPDFELTDLAGDVVRLHELRGKPVVIEFGSYTCPLFRANVNELEQLRRGFGGDVHWLLVYTREAHPSDGWVVPLNEREGIEVPQHTVFAERLQCAKRCARALGLSARVLVDGIADGVTETYGGHPNRGYVIDADGMVVSRQIWIEPARTRLVLEALLETSNR